jgi:hypothetical protein
MQALEPTVLAEYSKDETLMRLYGPNAVSNDVYLYNAAHFSVFKEEVLQHYDPYNPSAAQLDNAKRRCKKTRSINKTVHLAKQYFAGTRKIYETLREEGLDVTYETVEQICRDWHELYQGIDKFNSKLQAEWEHNRGWIYNGVYRPQAVDERSRKDLVNRFCQSTGHDILLMLLTKINHHRKARQIPMYPWMVDFHDETVWEVEEAYADEAAAILTQSLTEVNEWLDPVIPIKGEPMIADNLADIKCGD